MTAAVAAPPRPLRIGLMLRAVDDVDGQGIYIRKLCEALFELDSQNQYVAYYWRPDQVGRYADHRNVREVVVPGRNKLVWDQVLVPLAARRDRLDVLFHHKYSIPLLAPCPTVVQQRGTEYWGHPEFYTGWSGRVDQAVRPGHDPALLPPGRAGAHQLRHPGRRAGAVRRRSPSQAAHGVRVGGRELPADRRSGGARRGAGAVPAAGRSPSS